MSTLAWSHRVAEIREAKSFSRQADGDECRRMSERIGNAECLALAAHYRVRPDGGARYRVDGRVTARLEQVCGVTLDAMFQDIDEVIDVVFEEGDGGRSVEDVGFDPLADDPPEAISNGRIHVGEIIAEIVALAADPFPRSAGSELEQWEAGGDTAAVERGDNPFEKLKGLSTRPRENED